MINSVKNVFKNFALPPKQVMVIMASTLLFGCGSVDSVRTSEPTSLQQKVGSDTEPLWQGKGRIAISSDGNEHDHDDWPATPFSLALLASQGLQDKVTLYTFSDHIWGSNQAKPNAEEEMRISAYGAQKHFGFDNTVFIEAVAEPTKAINTLTTQINQSTANDPLFIIAAGPMEVVGQAIAQAKTSALQYVTLISHSQWNNKHSDKPIMKQPGVKSNHFEPHHSGWTFKEIETDFANKKLTLVQIVDQNGGEDYDGMRATIEKFEWVKTSSYQTHAAYQEGSWPWLYTRLESCIKNKETEFDPSDAGLIIFLLTGKQKTDPDDARIIMENPKDKL